MLRKQNRFHGHNSLRFVYKNGKAIRGHFFTLKFTSNPRAKSPRVSIVVGKKVLKSAVGRNRIRRRMYELVRHRLDSLPHNIDLVCIVTSAEVAFMEAAVLKGEFDRLFQEVTRSGTINGSNQP